MLNVPADILKEIDNKADEYIENVREIPLDKRAERVNHIKKLFGKSREYGDDKVQLAMQTYEMVRPVPNRIQVEMAVALLLLWLHITCDIVRWISTYVDWTPTSPGLKLNSRKRLSVGKA